MNNVELIEMKNDLNILFGKGYGELVEKMKPKEAEKNIQIIFHLD
jgi:hypothetical protein